MQNKEQILELQAIFSRRHIGILVAMLLFMTNNLIINNNNDGMKYISCAVICLVLMLDVFFAYFSFFHKYVLVVILRFAEMASTEGVEISLTCPKNSLEKPRT